MLSRPYVTMPSEYVVRVGQQASCQVGRDSPEPDPWFAVSIGRVVVDDEGKYRVVIDGRTVL